ncbi:putative membrane protein, partial [Helicobacter pylori]
MIGFCRFRGFA